MTYVLKVLKKGEKEQQQQKQQKSTVIISGSVLRTAWIYLTRFKSFERRVRENERKSTAIIAGSVFMTAFRTRRRRKLVTEFILNLFDKRS